jgi:hypothetical protein
MEEAMKLFARLLGRKCLALLALGASTTSLTVMPTRALAVTLDDVTFGNDAFVGFSYLGTSNLGPGNFFAGNTPITAPGSYSASASYAGSVSASAQVDVALNPAPFSSATATVSRLGGSGIGFANASAIFYYNMKIAGPGGPFSPVQLNITAAGGTSSSLGGQAQASLRIGTGPNHAGVTSLDAMSIGGQPHAGLPGSFSISDAPYSFNTDVLYFITIYATAFAEVRPNSSFDSATASAFLDPIFSFADPSDANRYELFFSPGVGNSLETPIPAALPLFATGLGVLAFIARRRKQKLAALAAA